ncbi:L-asparaginase [Lottiidibacillus patelloidae]|uniref:L-asparaginase n=1 Tax=Lottiidibacillus patelloidae TaxID=2670334 RepID=A0A263BTC6_9BACI|nr:asparaginase [Lottiidibacillus patelloidae]OZM56970.1 L-asparaginase [Lottiidibacillus patelloidae]
MTKPIQMFRGDYLESAHDIHVAVVDNTGKLLYSYGDPNRLTFPRSSMKPFQTVPVIETGTARKYQFGAKELALFCASHAGEDYHRRAVLEVLKKVDLKESDLQCGYHIPFHHASYVELLKSGKDLSERYSNCSGKHSGMLATVVHMKEDIETYRLPEHPVQKRILQSISDICNVDMEKIELSVDGCGVPVHRVPLYNAALGYAKLVKPEGTVSSKRAQSLKTIRDAMMQLPEMVAGTDRFDTDVMRSSKGNIVSKVGAEAVQCVGVLDRGIGIAVKIEDGSQRAETVAMMEVLKQLGIGDETFYAKMRNYTLAPVLNMRKEKIGVVKANFTLKKHL